MATLRTAVLCLWLYHSVRSTLNPRSFQLDNVDTSIHLSAYELSGYSLSLRLCHVKPNRSDGFQRSNNKAFCVV